MTAFLDSTLAAAKSEIRKALEDCLMGIVDERAAIAHALPRLRRAVAILENAQKIQAQLEKLEEEDEANGHQ